MNNRMPLIFLMILLPWFGTACGGDEPAAEVEVYEVKGRFLSMDMRGESISVVHETIPDVMNAMRMSLRIDNPEVAEELETGDVIRFDMVRTEAGLYARNIEVLPPNTELDLPEGLQDAGRPR
ncbi:MAG: copper-binding protein [Cyclonatronaceae bacterium]